MTPPYFVTPEIQERIEAMIDSHPQDLSIIADTIQYEYPELSGRQCGLAVLKVKEMIQCPKHQN
jgi:hypothetical protein